MTNTYNYCHECNIILPNNEVSILCKSCTEINNEECAKPAVKTAVFKNKKEVCVMDFYNYNSGRDDLEEYEMASLRYEQYTGDYYND